MPPNESPSVSVSPRGHGGLGREPFRTVVWIRGEHDIATRADLAATIAEAAHVYDADVIVDLSGVTFMDASTIGALVGAHNYLRASSRSLSVRAPSARARRLLDLCRLARLIDERPALEQRPAATALASWVDVPASDRDPDSAQPPDAHDTSSQERAHPTARRRAEPAESIPQPRAAP